MTRRDHRDLAIEQFADEAIGVEDLAGAFLRDAQSYRDFLHLALADVAKLTAQNARQQQQLTDLRAELRRYTSRQVLPTQEAA